MNVLNVLDLFSGIGGFSLGLERAGMRTVAFCEIDPYCQAVLRKHWPDVPVFDDVRTFPAEELMADTKGIRCDRWATDFGREGATDQQWSHLRGQLGGQGIDVICGGFPCQDISVAGKGEGIEGERSGLWSEYARIVGEVRPRYVIVENVAALLGRGLSRVLGDLAALGYDAEWHCIPASAVGAPHRRDRVWIIAHSGGSGRQPDAAGYGLSPQSTKLQSENGQTRPDHGEALCGDVADANGTGQQQRWRPVSISQELAAFKCAGEIPDTAGAGRNGTGAIKSTNENGSRSFREPSRPDWWKSEPNVGRVAHGVPLRVDRLRALGNAIVPQIAEIIGKAIMELGGGGKD